LKVATINKCGRPTACGDALKNAKSTCVNTTDGAQRWRIPPPSAGGATLKVPYYTTMAGPRRRKRLRRLKKLA